MAPWRVLARRCSVLAHIRSIIWGLGPRPLPMTSRSAQGAVLSVSQLLVALLCWPETRDSGTSSLRPVSPPGLEAVFLEDGEVSSYL